MGLEWDTFWYWCRRAEEVKTGKFIEESSGDGKIDDVTFEISKKRLYDRLERNEKAKQGTISG